MSDLIGALLALGGSIFFLAAAVGLVRLPCFYTRAHAPTKAATLGLLLTVLGSIAMYAERDFAFVLEKAVLILFVLLTVPLSTQMLVRSAAARGIPQCPTSLHELPARPLERLEEDDDADADAALHG